MESGPPTITVIKNKNAARAVAAALASLSAWDIAIKSHSHILIKVNLCGGVAGEPGSYTSVSVLEAVLAEVSSFAMPLYIGEADCSFNDAEHMFTALNIYACAKRYGARVVNLSKGTWLDLPVPSPLNMKSVRVAEVFHNAFIISVPVLKTHPWTNVTITMKNMYGAIYPREKSVYHSGLDENIVDINKVIKPHLSIVDGTVAVVSGGFKYGLWVGSPPTRLDCIIVGQDPVAVDALGAKILGHDPDHIGYIKKAAQQRLGICKIEDINLTGNGVSLLA
ncbi:MAG: DUF362 domain-containing protein [Desulfobacterota bacterium]|nr:DUF362 domain-containing protein [Thermodesulfobacteriota bacterium]